MTCEIIERYYLDKGALLGTTTLVALARPCITDFSDVYSVCHLSCDVTIPAFFNVLQVACSQRIVFLILFLF